MPSQLPKYLVSSNVDPSDIRVDQKKEVILHRGALRALARIGTQVYCDRDITVSRSHMLRALCQLLENYEPQIVEQLRAERFGGRPPNGEQADERRHAFERQIAAAVSRAVILGGALGATNANETQLPLSGVC